MKFSETLSVIVPCFNEEEIIYTNIHALAGYLKQHFGTFEIIVVNDGSTDHTAEEVEKAQKELPDASIHFINNSQNQGKGQAVKDGALQSQHEIVLFLDADLTVPIEEIEKFLPVLKENDIVIASRILPETVFEEKVPWYRAFLAKGFQISQRILTGNADIPDTQCGFKAFNQTAAKHIFPLLSVKRFAFDAEIIFLAQRFGYSIKQLPVRIQKDNRQSHIHVFRDPLNMFFDLMKIRTYALLGKYPSQTQSPAFDKAKTEDSPA
jgi:dolichyl-phosphate beta-glucosyltransferase